VLCSSQPWSTILSSSLQSLHNLHVQAAGSFPNPRAVVTGARFLQANLQAHLQVRSLQSRKAS